MSTSNVIARLDLSGYWRNRHANKLAHSERIPARIVAPIVNESRPNAHRYRGECVARHSRVLLANQFTIYVRIPGQSKRNREPAARASRHGIKTVSLANRRSYPGTLKRRPGVARAKRANDPGVRLFSRESVPTPKFL